jgi:type VI protein secretion system component VasK
VTLLLEALLVLAALVLLWRLVAGRNDRPVTDDQAHSDGEADRLRAEVRELKERIQVLERITVDKENSLARQIEELRDRP